MRIDCCRDYCLKNKIRLSSATNLLGDFRANSHEMSKLIISRWVWGGDGGGSVNSFHSATAI